MDNTLVQSLINRFDTDTENAEKLLDLAYDSNGNDISGIKSGLPGDTLSVRAHIGDIAVSNDLFGRAVELLPGEVPTELPAILAHLAPREAYSSEQSMKELKRINGAITAALEDWTDEDLSQPAHDPFTGAQVTRHEVLLHAVVHHGVHEGKAWQLLHGAGISAS
jgi:hypothetical protein